MSLFFCVVFFFGIAGIAVYAVFKLPASRAPSSSDCAEITVKVTDCIAQMLKAPFVFTKYFDADNGWLSPPDALWFDPYIAGFIHKTITASLNMDYPHVSQMYKDEIIECSLMNLSNGRLGGIISRYPYSSIVNDGDKALLLAGEHDAKIAHAILADELGKHYIEPELKKAYSLNSYSEEPNLIAAYSLGRVKGYPVLPCFWSLTIHKYIKENILTDEFPELVEPN